jgi:hypothetical protein
VDNFIEGKPRIEKERRSMEQDKTTILEAMIDYKHKEGLEREKELWLKSRRLGMIQLKICLYKFYR